MKKAHKLTENFQCNTSTPLWSEEWLKGIQIDHRSNQIL